MKEKMLEGKVAIISGASYGMGFSMAELFASEGELESPRLQEADTAGVTASTDVHELLHNGLRIQVKVDIAPAE